MATESRSCESCRAEFRTNAGYLYCPECRPRVKERLYSVGYTKALPGPTVPMGIRRILWRMRGVRR